MHGETRIKIILMPFLGHFVALTLMFKMNKHIFNDYIYSITV